MISSFPPPAPGPYVGDEATVAWLLDGFAEERYMWSHTSDLSDDFFVSLVDMCRRLECRPVDMAGCWTSESDLSSRARNPNGNATGIFQAMPATLDGIGFHKGWQAFQAISAKEQLVWAEKYYGPHRGLLVSPGACYLATFLPALMAHAGEPDFVLTSDKVRSWAYGPNRVFDANHDLRITVSELSDRIAHVTVGPRWQEISDRIRMVEKERDTDPDMSVVADNRPIFILPDEGDS